MVAEVARDSKGEWWEITDMLGIEKACMVENKARFSPAIKAKKLHTTPPLRQFGYLEKGTNAREVLIGEYIPPPQTD